MTFNDYLSSEITPQDTLLQKFNKIIKWLETGCFTQKLYKHDLTSNGGTHLIFISTSNYKITETGTSFMSKVNELSLSQLQCKYMGDIYPCKLAYSGTNTIDVDLTNFEEFLSSTFDTEDFTQEITEL